MGRNPRITEPAFYRTDKQTALITSGTTHADPVNLSQNWAFPVVVIPSVQGAASQTLTIQVAYDDGDALVPLYTKDTGAVWSKTLPASGGMAFILTDAAFAQKLKFTLSTGWTNPGSFAGFAIHVYGFEKGYG